MQKTKWKFPEKKVALNFFTHFFYYLFIELNLIGFIFFSFVFNIVFLDGNNFFYVAIEFCFACKTIKIAKSSNDFSRLVKRLDTGPWYGMSQTACHTCSGVLGELQGFNLSAEYPHRISEVKCKSEKIFIVHNSLSFEMCALNLLVKILNSSCHSNREVVGSFKLSMRFLMYRRGFILYRRGFMNRSGLRNFGGSDSLAEAQPFNLCGDRLITKSKGKRNTPNTQGVRRSKRKRTKSVDSTPSDINTDSSNSADTQPSLNVFKEPIGVFPVKLLNQLVSGVGEEHALKLISCRKCKTHDCELCQNRLKSLSNDEWREEKIQFWKLKEFSKALNLSKVFQNDSEMKMDVKCSECDDTLTENEAKQGTDNLICKSCKNKKELDACKVTCCHDVDIDKYCEQCSLSKGNEKEATSMSIAERKRQKKIMKNQQGYSNKYGIETKQEDNDESTGYTNEELLEKEAQRSCSCMFDLYFTIDYVTDVQQEKGLVCTLKGMKLMNSLLRLIMIIKGMDLLDVKVNANVQLILALLLCVAHIAKSL